MNRSPRKSAEQWAQLIDEYTTGEQSEREFCVRHDIKLASLRKWRYHFKSLQKTNNTAAKSSSPFVKVNIASAPPSADAAVLCIGADIRLECPAHYDVSSLAQLALAVHHGR